MGYGERKMTKNNNDDERGGGDKTCQDTQILALFELQWRGVYHEDHEGSK
jgi:hypothetical protein